MSHLVRGGAKRAGAIDVYLYVGTLMKPCVVFLQSPARAARRENSRIFYAGAPDKPFCVSYIPAREARREFFCILLSKSPYKTLCF